MKERVGVRVDLFFMSLKIRKQIKTPAGSFFHEHGNRIASWGLGGLLFHELDNKRGRKPRFGLFSRDSFFLTLACYNGRRKL